MATSDEPAFRAWSLTAASPTVASFEGTAARRSWSNDYILRRLLAICDAIAAIAALAVALAVAADANVGARLLWGFLALPLIVLLFKLYGLYDRDVKRISHSTVDDLPWLFHATMTGTLLLWLYSKVTPPGQLDFLEVTLFAVLLIGFVTLLRTGLRSLRPRLLGAETALLVGGGELARIVVSKLDAHPEHGLRVIGLLAADAPTQPSWHGLDVLGSVTDVGPVATALGASRVIVSPGDLDEDELEHLLHRCRNLALKVTLVPQLSDLLGPAVEIDDVEGITLLGVNPPWLPRSSRAIKRMTDIVIAMALLVALSPLVAVIAIAIKLDSSGPVFFSQERIGRGGRRFRLFKFRTMVNDAERRRAELLSQSTDRNWLKLERDPRITRIGRFVRRLSLDEIPQVWNVLRGEMSMVGPRPLIEAEDDRVEGWARGRLDLTPGITGYWQVLGRTRIPFEEMVKLDYLYAMNWSLWGDLRLMLRTLPTVVSGRGAN